jgi:glycosyltransferase involved in cell wall biosynthesis
VLEQQFDNYEIIAIDDGSTDASFDILKDYSNRLKVIRQRNRGAAAARNTGARAAGGQYLAFLDADDEWLPGKLRACANALDASTNAAIAYSDMIGSDGTRIKFMNGSPTLDYLLANPFALFPSATVVRREAFERCGGFSEEFSRNDIGEDIFFGLLLRESGEFVHIPEPLVVYHGSSAATILAKYPRGYRTFTRLAKQRYGRRASGARLMMRQYYASMLVIAALQEMRERRFTSALWNLVRATRVSPSYVVNCGFERIKTMKRAAPNN